MRGCRVNLVLVGAEGVVENGGIINKLGSYHVAIAAKEHGIPFYVAAESYKVDVQPQWPTAMSHHLNAFHCIDHKENMHCTLCDVRFWVAHVARGDLLNPQHMMCGSLVLC